MAKDKTQTLALWNKMADVYESARDHLVAVQALLALVETEIKVGGPEDYMKVMDAELKQLEKMLNHYWTAHQLFATTINMPLGAIAGVANPIGSIAVNMSRYNDMLVNDGESIASHDQAKGAWTPDGGNSGDAEVVELTTGVDGADLDCMHHETLRLVCDAISNNGRGQYRLEGGAIKFYDFDAEMGTGNAEGGYRFKWGAGVNDFTRHVRILTTDAKNNMVAWEGSDHRCMIKNASLEAELGSGNGKVPGATFLTGESNVAEDVATPIKGLRSLSATGDFELEFPMFNVRIGVPQFITILLRRTGTKTGNWSFGFRSDVAGVPTDHASIGNIDVTTLVAATVYMRKLVFIVPQTFGSNPRVFVKFASSGSTGNVTFDDVVPGILSLFDGSRCIAVVEKTNPSRKGDLFTAAQTMTTPSDFQRMANELFGRSLFHEAVADFWTRS